MYKNENELIGDLEEAIKNDETLPEKLENAKNEKEFKSVLGETKVNLTDEEVSAMYQEFRRQLSDELNEENLENVSGGSVVAGVTIIAAGVAFTVGVLRGMRCRRR